MRAVWQSGTIVYATFPGVGVETRWDPAPFEEHHINCRREVLNAIPLNLQYVTWNVEELGFLPMSTVHRRLSTTRRRYAKPCTLSALSSVWFYCDARFVG